MKKITIGELKSETLLEPKQEEVFDRILNYQDDTELTLEELKEDIEKARDTSGEIVDSLVNVYTADLLKWYSEDLDRVHYMSEAINEEEATDGFKVLTGGQYLYYSELVNEVIDKIEEVCYKINIETEE